MPRRLRSVLLSLLALIAAAGSAGCASDVSPAVRVGDTAIANDEFLDEVEQWVGNEAAIDPAMAQASAPEAYPIGLVGQILAQRIDFEIHRQRFEELGLTVDDELRSQAIEVVFGDEATADQALGGFSESFARSFIDDVARQIGVEAELGEDGYATWRAEGYAGTDVEVNPRYGSWDERTGQVVPPAGPVQESGDPAGAAAG